MARRKKSSHQTLWIVVAVLLVGAAFLGSAMFRATGNDPFRTVPLLDIPAFLENANSLRGNVYKVEGEVSNSLAWSPSSGRLIAVDVEDETIPVLVTTEFNATNIQKGQKFIFVIEVDENGLLKTKNLSKA